MSDVATSAPGGSEGAPAPIAVVTPAADTGANLSISQAAQALAAARHKPKEQTQESAAPPEVETPPESAQADDAQPQADPVETTETPEPDASPPIEPPRSWTKEAKERWQSLPRETQEYLASREQERDREVRRSQNEAAEKTKALTAKEQAVEQARQQYEAALPFVLQRLANIEAGQFPDIKNIDDAKKLATDDPFRFAQWQAHQMEVQDARQKYEAANQRQTDEFRKKWSEFASKQDQLLLDRAPELANKARQTKVEESAVGVLKDLGFTDQELVQAWNGEASISPRDVRFQLLLLDAVKYREAKAKPAPIAKPVPPVQRPGVAKPAGAGNSEVIQNLTAKLERTGSLRAAQELRAAQVRSQRRA